MASLLPASALADAATHGAATSAAQVQSPAARPPAAEAPPDVRPAELRFQPWVGPSDPRDLREPQTQERVPPDDRDAWPFSRHVDHGGYGGPALKISKVLDTPAVFVGAQAGWLIDHALSLGLAGFGLATRHDVPLLTRVEGRRSVLGFGYGGVDAAYACSPSRRVHAGAGLLLGAGGSVATLRAGDSRDSFDAGPSTRRRAHADALFVLEPRAELELHVVRFMRIALSVSYRYVAAVNAPGLNSQKLSAPAGGLTFKFGYF